MSELLDDELRSALTAHRKRWLDIVFACEPTPTESDDAQALSSHEQVREAFELIYQGAGLPLPEYVIWLTSPLAGAAAASILGRTRENVFSRTWSNPYQLMFDRMWRKAEMEDSISLWKGAEDELTREPLAVLRYIVEPIRTQIGLQMEARFGPTMGPPHAYQQMFTTETWETILDYLSPQLMDEDRIVLDQLRSRDTFAYQEAGKQSWYCGLGSHDAESLCFLDFVDKNWFPLPGIKGLVKLAEHCGWWWTFEDACIITSRPSVVHLNDDRKLHNDLGYAIEYPDGWGIYSRHGSFVPERVIEFSHRKNLEAIHREQNAEVRRHMIELYGLERYIKDAEAVKIDEDACGALYRRDSLIDEPIVVVKVKNSTPEPDGTYKYYFLRVPPEIDTARAAVAWTFGLTPDEYTPEVET